MRKKFIIIIAVLVGMSCTLGMLDFLLDSWESRELISKIIGILALFGWVYITYGMVTLKFKWIRRLTK